MLFYFFITPAHTFFFILFCDVISSMLCFIFIDFFAFFPRVSLGIIIGVFFVGLGAGECVCTCVVVWYTYVCMLVGRSVFTFSVQLTSTVINLFEYIVY